MSERQIPFSIAVNAKEFLAGIAAEEAAQNTVRRKAIEEINKFVTSIDSDLRKAYDRLIPNVHVVNIETFTNLIANRISLNPERFLDAGSDTSIAFNFSNKNSREYKGLYKVILDAVSKYHSKLLSTQQIANPVKYLNELSLDLFKRGRKLDNTISARILGAEFGTKVRQVFGRVSNLAVIEPELGSSNTTFVFFSSSFDAISNPMRLQVYEPIKEYIRDTLGTDTISKLDVGATVNIGHAALVNDIGAYVNSPAMTAALYGVASGRSNLGNNFNLHEVAAVFKTESRITENSIKVTKELTSTKDGLGVLLALGVTFTNVEDADLNSYRGSTSERTALSKYKISKPGPLSKSAVARLTDSIFRIVLRKNPVLGRSSKNLLEFIDEGFRGILVGKPIKSEKTSTVISSKIQKVVAVATNGKATKFSNPKVSKPKTNLSTRATKGSENPLTSLQKLLDANLSTQIEKNMGDGTATRVLNYRTGRLAESAKVERLSKSREGMITAFYSYMRNPYGTFSEGGAQQSPKTRDPKLLISKSIREIGATLAYNRMRAVLV